MKFNIRNLDQYMARGTFTDLDENKNTLLQFLLLHAYNEIRTVNEDKMLEIVDTGPDNCLLWNVNLDGKTALMLALKFYDILRSPKTVQLIGLILDQGAKDCNLRHGNVFMTIARNADIFPAPIFLKALSYGPVECNLSTVDAIDHWTALQYVCLSAWQFQTEPEKFKIIHKMLDFGPDAVALAYATQKNPPAIHMILKCVTFALDYPTIANQGHMTAAQTVHELLGIAGRMLSFGAKACNLSHPMFGLGMYSVTALDELLLVFSPEQRWKNLPPPEIKQFIMLMLRTFTAAELNLAHKSGSGSNRTDNSSFQLAIDCRLWDVADLMIRRFTADELNLNSENVYRQDALSMATENPQLQAKIRRALNIAREPLETTFDRLTLTVPTTAAVSHRRQPSAKRLSGYNVFDPISQSWEHEPHWIQNPDHISVRHNGRVYGFAVSDLQRAMFRRYACQLLGTQLLFTQTRRSGQQYVQIPVPLAGDGEAVVVQWPIQVSNRRRRLHLEDTGIDLQVVSKEYADQHPNMRDAAAYGQGSEFVSYTTQDAFYMDRYSKYWDHAVNAYLRRDPPLSDAETAAEPKFVEYSHRFGISPENALQNIKQTIDGLDGAFLRSPLTEETTVVWRGSGTRTDGLQRGYLSCTVKRSIAKQFAMNEGVLYRLHIEPGVPFILMNYFSRYGSLHDPDGAEMEVLLPRDLVITPFGTPRQIGQSVLVDATVSPSRLGQYAKRNLCTAARLYSLVPIGGHRRKSLRLRSVVGRRRTPRNTPSVSTESI